MQTYLPGAICLYLFTFQSVIYRGVKTIPREDLFILWAEVSLNGRMAGVPAAL